MHHFLFSCIYRANRRHKSVHKSSVPDSETHYYYIIIIIIIVKAYLNVLSHVRYVFYMSVCMYVYMLYVVPELLKKPQPIPRVFAQLGEIKLI